MYCPSFVLSNAKKTFITLTLHMHVLHFWGIINFGINSRQFQRPIVTNNYNLEYLPADFQALSRGGQSFSCVNKPAL